MKHQAEMKHLVELYKAGIITKERALELFQQYLENNLGRRAFREFPYKNVSDYKIAA